MENAREKEIENDPVSDADRSYGLKRRSGRGGRLGGSSRLSFRTLTKLEPRALMLSLKCGM